MYRICQFCKFSFGLLRIASRAVGMPTSTQKNTLVCSIFSIMSTGVSPAIVSNACSICSVLASMPEVFISVCSVSRQVSRMYPPSMYWKYT